MTGNDFLSDFLLTLGPRHASDQMIVESVAKRLKCGDLKSVKDLDGILEDSDLKEWLTAWQDSQGVILKLKPAPRRKFGEKRANVLYSLGEIGF